MKTPLHRDDRLDDLDAGQFERMLASKPWQIYVERLGLEWDRVATRCQTEKDLIELRRAQGAASALQAVMAAPRIILQELRTPPAKRPRKAE